ncbi:hypothetical protein B0O80DRAFT_446698 [Mortierella sp. GBAus27b]|nr:hypothetical protein B0O80DRAFT_446698 [Mortierella sp. GBAus27b]
MAHPAPASSSSSTTTTTASSTTTSALFLKAKHALSLPLRRSSVSTSSSNLSPPVSSLHSTGTPPLTASSSASSASNAPTTATGSVSKPKRHSRFIVRTFPSFRDRSISPPDTKKGQDNAKNVVGSVATTASSSSTTGTTTAVTTTTTTITPPAPVVSVNPYSAAWCPSTVGALRSPLRSASSSRSGGDQDLLRPSHFSPAPNLILQPSPAVDLAPCYGTGARMATSRCLAEPAGGSHAPVIGPQGMIY